MKSMESDHQSTNLSESSVCVEHVFWEGVTQAQLNTDEEDLKTDTACIQQSSIDISCRNKIQGSASVNGDQRHSGEFSETQVDILRSIRQSCKMGNGHPKSGPETGPKEDNMRAELLCSSENEPLTYESCVVSEGSVGVGLDNSASGISEEEDKTDAPSDSKSSYDTATKIKPNLTCLAHSIMGEDGSNKEDLSEFDLWFKSNVVKQLTTELPESSDAVGATATTGGPVIATTQVPASEGDPTESTKIVPSTKTIQKSEEGLPEPDAPMTEIPAPPPPPPAGFLPKFDSPPIKRKPAAGKKTSERRKTNVGLLKQVESVQDQNFVDFIKTNWPEGEGSAKPGGQPRSVWRHEALANSEMIYSHFYENCWPVLQHTLTHDIMNSSGIYCNGAVFKEYILVQSFKTVISEIFDVGPIYIPLQFKPQIILWN